MKRIFSSLVLSALLPLFVSAQDFASYGIISPEEISLKECDFDKEAPAVILIDEAVTSHDDDYNMYTERHVRIKILKESGFKYADVEIPFYRKDKKEFIDRIEAVVINTDNNGKTTTTKVDKKSFYNKDINELWGAMVFAFPNVKTGSIIEYKYRKFSESYGFLNDWDFNDYLPVVKSAFTLNVPPRYEFTYQVKKIEEYPINIKRSESNGSVYFEMNNLPGLDDEPYMDARKDYLQRVTFQLSGVNSYYTGFRKQNTTWAEVINDFLSSSSFGSQLRKNLSGVGDFLDEVKKQADEKSKMQAVFEYVRSNMSWNGFQSRYAGDGVKDAWTKKSGNNGQINLILVNLLREADLDAYPLLVSERWHGIVETNYPFVDQFNTVYAYVMVNNTPYYLDASDKFTPFNIIPEEILNTKALLVDRKKGKIIDVSDNKVLFFEYVNDMITVDSAGNASGEATIKSDSYAKVEKKTYLKEKGSNKFIDHYLPAENFKVSDFKVTNAEKDSGTLEQEFKFEGKLNASGGYYFVPLNNFTGYIKNPFLKQHRYSDINFGYPKQLNTYTQVQIPGNMLPETLPKSLRMVTPEKDIAFTRTVEYDKSGNYVTCMIQIIFLKSLYNYYEYDILQQVYKKIFEYLNEPLVLKNKN